MAAKVFLVPIDLAQNELQNAVIQNLASFPVSPLPGQLVFRTSDDILYWYDGTTWQSASGGGGGGAVNSVTAGDATITIGGTGADPTVAVAKTLDHTWIVDFDAQVRTSRLDQMAAPTSSVDLNGQKIINLADGTSSGDAVNFGQLAAVVQGVSFKDPVRVATVSNGALSTAFANGQVVDGITLVTGDRILLDAQTNQVENGIYTVNASGAPTRATDADSNGEIKPGTFVPVVSGTANAGSVFYCVTTSASPWVPGSSSSTWAKFPSLNDLVAGDGLVLTGNTLSVGQGTGIIVNTNDVAIDTSIVVRKYVATIGNGSSTSIAVNHGLGTQDITVSIRDASTNAFVECDVVATSTSVATFNFTNAPASNSLRVVIHG